jgi:two-component system sensor histidine kinase KdpD
MEQADATWFPLRTATTVMGVLGISIPAHSRMEYSMQQMINSFALQLALVLEKEQFIHALNQAEVEEASEKLRHVLLDSVSHELKTPLAALQSATDDIAQNPDEARNIVPELQSALRRLRRTVDNLLNMTRVESGDVTPMLDWCDVDELCDSAVELIGDALIHHRFYLNVPKNLPIVKVDRALIEQALVNFLLNAAMHTPSGCEVILRAYMQGQNLMLSVLDRGPGLPNMNLDDLFQKFARGNQAPAGGSGLGLAIARGFARAHSGEAIACPREGGGAEFTLKIPVETLDEFTDETCPPYSPSH